MANTAARLRKLSGWLIAHDADMKMPRGMIDPEIAADEIARLRGALAQIAGGKRGPKEIAQAALKET